MPHLEDIDLRHLARSLSECFRHSPPMGYLRGKTAMRDQIESSFGCSALEAEALVDTLESRGFLHFDGDPQARSVADAPWLIVWKRAE